MLINLTDEGNVNVNNFVQTKVQDPAFQETINSILTATNQEQSTNIALITSTEILGFIGNCPTISHRC